MVLTCEDEHCEGNTEELMRMIPGPGTAAQYNGRTTDIVLESEVPQLTDVVSMNGTIRYDNVSGVRSTPGGARENQHTATSITSIHTQHDTINTSQTAHSSDPTLAQQSKQAIDMQQQRGEVRQNTETLNKGFNVQIAKLREVPSEPKNITPGPELLPVGNTDTVISMQNHYISIPPVAETPVPPHLHNVKDVTKSINKDAVLAAWEFDSMTCEHNSMHRYVLESSAQSDTSNEGLLDQIRHKLTSLLVKAKISCKHRRCKKVRQHSKHHKTACWLRKEKRRKHSRRRDSLERRKKRHKSFHTFLTSDCCHANRQYKCKTHIFDPGGINSQMWFHTTTHKKESKLATKYLPTLISTTQLDNKPPITSEYLLVLVKKRLYCLAESRKRYQKFSKVNKFQIATHNLFLLFHRPFKVTEVDTENCYGLSTIDNQLVGQYNLTQLTPYKKPEVAV
ncbi:hypothetical protein PR048_012376 [Dryococelus australis]|uniref:Uncharacterized protein n=1 Tax=Dryococelus australis TaxID=614101 RepID=A0ABQ9HPA6_9NEOP|nr:hypothetical protein PR048_012376 [Dryococelus australis]